MTMSLYNIKEYDKEEINEQRKIAACKRFQKLENYDISTADGAYNFVKIYAEPLQYKTSEVTLNEPKIDNTSNYEIDPWKTPEVRYNYSTMEAKDATNLLQRADSCNQFLENKYHDAIANMKNFLKHYREEVRDPKYTNAGQKLGFFKKMPDGIEKSRQILVSGIDSLNDKQVADKFSKIHQLLTEKNENIKSRQQQPLVQDKFRKREGIVETLYKDQLEKMNSLSTIAKKQDHSMGR